MSSLLEKFNVLILPLAPKWSRSLRDHQARTENNVEKLRAGEKTTEKNHIYLFELKPPKSYVWRKRAIEVSKMVGGGILKSMVSPSKLVTTLSLFLNLGVRSPSETDRWGILFGRI